VPKNDGSTSNPVFDAMLLAAISFGGKERKKTEDFVSETCIRKSQGRTLNYHTRL